MISKKKHSNKIYGFRLIPIMTGVFFAIGYELTNRAIDSRQISKIKVTQSIKQLSPSIKSQSNLKSHKKGNYLESSDNLQSKTQKTAKPGLKKASRSSEEPKFSLNSLKISSETNLSEKELNQIKTNFKIETHDKKNTTRETNQKILITNLFNSLPDP